MTRYRWDKKTEKMVEAPTRESFRGVNVMSDLNPKIEVMTNE